MKYAPGELLTLSKRLSSAAAVARAKAAHHQQLREFDAADTETKRADDATHFAEVCSYFAAVCTTKAKRADFTPPALHEVILFIAGEKDLCCWPEADVRAWYDHFNSNGWKVSGVTKMVDWQAAARNGARRWLRDNQKGRAVRQGGNNDPKNWEQFCLGQGITLKPFQYASDWIKTQFREWDKRA